MVARDLKGFGLSQQINQWRVKRWVKAVVSNHADKPKAFYRNSWLEAFVEVLK